MVLRRRKQRSPSSARPRLLPGASVSDQAPLIIGRGGVAVASRRRGCAIDVTKRPVFRGEHGHHRGQLLARLRRVRLFAPQEDKTKGGEDDYREQPSGYEP